MYCLAHVSNGSVNRTEHLNIDTMTSEFSSEGSDYEFGSDYSTDCESDDNSVKSVPSVTTIQMDATPDIQNDITLKDLESSDDPKYYHQL